MTEQTIKATNETIHDIVEQEIERLGNNADLNHIDVSEVTDMSNLFDFSDQELEFNEDLQKWDISQWDVSNVVNMEGMFANSLFNGNISKWNVSNVRDMKFMFSNAMFEGDLSDWGISPIADKQHMFSESPLEEKYGTDAEYLGKAEIKATDETIEQIVKQEIERLGNNADLNHIDVSEVTDMRQVFFQSHFNGDISQWDVSNVEKMNLMFDGSEFNGDISGWDVSNVKEMPFMFNISKFNGDISSWDVSNVEKMSMMFFASPLEREYGTSGEKLKK